MHPFGEGPCLRKHYLITVLRTVRRGLHGDAIPPVLPPARQSAQNNHPAGAQTRALARGGLGRNKNRLLRRREREDVLGVVVRRRSAVQRDHLRRTVPRRKAAVLGHR